MWNKKRSHPSADAGYHRGRGGVLAQMRDTVVGYAFWGVIIIALILLVIFLIGKCSNSGTSPWPGSSGSNGNGSNNASGNQNQNTNESTPITANNTPVEPVTNGGAGNALNFVAVRFHADPNNPARIHPFHATVVMPDGKLAPIEAADNTTFLKSLGEYLKVVRDRYPDLPLYIEDFQISSGELWFNDTTRNDIAKAIMNHANYTQAQIEWKNTRALQRLINKE